MKTASAAIGIVGASLALAFSLIAVGFVPHPTASIGTTGQQLVMLLPATLTSVLLALGVLAFHVDAKSDAAGAPLPESRLTRLLVPLVLISPFAASLIEAALQRSGAISPLAIETVAASLNVAIMAALLFWGAARATRQRAALEDLTQAVDSAPIALTDADGCITHWSRGCEELYGWRASEAIGRQKYELLRATCLPFEAASIAPEDGSGEHILAEIRADGATVRVLEQAQWVQRPGKPPMQVLSMIDVGPRLDAEAAMRESEERLSLATSAHEVGVFDWDVRTNRITWSAGSEQRLGFEAGALSDFTSWSQLILAEDLAAIRTAIEQATATRADRFGFKYRVRNPDDTMRSIEGSARCFYGHDGALVRTVGVSIDVTAHEEREATLYAQRAQLRSILETVPDAMVVVDERGIITRFSRAAENLFGHARRQAIGRHVSMLMSERRRMTQQNILRRYAETGDGRLIGGDRTLTAMHADGRDFPIELRIGEANVGNERMYTAFVRDISERLLSEERLSQLGVELTHVSRLNAMGEMAASLAHELNQPLAAIVNFLTTAEFMLKQGAPSESAGEMLAMASEQAIRAGEIIRRLREFIVRRDTEMGIEPVASTVQDAVALVLVGAQRVDVRVLYDLDPAADMMLADRIQVQQVLVNLLRNSVEALASMPQEQQEVRVSSRRVSNDLLEIRVCDTGPGIPETVLSRMYSPFTSTKGEKGMGIGLSICRRIVEAHGGKIVAENMPDGGACFRFTLPCVEEKELAA